MHTRKVITLLNFVCSNFAQTDHHASYFHIHCGFPITTIGFIAPDTHNYNSIILQDQLLNPILIFNRHTKLVDAIFLHICDTLDIKQKHIIHDFILKTSLEIIDSIEDEDIYQEKITRLQKKNIHFNTISYDHFKNQNIIYIITALLFISVQTYIPSIKSKIFQESKQSFSGYPMKTLSEDQSGIQYVSSAVFKLKSHSFPWDAILNTKLSFFKENLLKKIVILLQRTDIKLMYQTKSTYDSDSSKHIKFINTIHNWIGILPPFLPFTVIKDIKHVTNDIHQEFINLVSRGNKTQRKFIAMYKSKISLYGYAIIELINNVVQSYQLNNYDSHPQIPINEDKCCYQHKHSTTLKYFIHKNNSLLHIINFSQKSETVIFDIKQLDTPSILIFPTIPTRKHSISPKGVQFKANMYKSFIFHLKLDQSAPLPNIYSSIFEVKPLNYDINLPFDEKCKLLEKDGNKYNIHTLDKLLQIKFQSNIFSTNPIDTEEYDPYTEYLHFIHLKLHGLLQENIPKSSLEELLFFIHNTPKIDDLKLYLSNSITNMQQLISKNVCEHVSLTKNEMELWDNDLYGISEWTKWNIYSKNHNSSIPLILNNLKNAIFNITHTYPSITKNKISLVHLICGRNVPVMFNYANQVIDNEDIEQQVTLHFEQCTKKLTPLIAFFDFIPPYNYRHALYDEQICQSLYTFSWLYVFRTFLDMQLQIDNNIQTHIIQRLYLFLQIEINKKQLIDSNNDKTLSFFQ